MDISDEDFVDEFSTFGYNIDNDDILDKLKQICQMHELDAGDLCVQWVAFVQSMKFKKLSVELLDQLERDRLSKGASKQTKTPSRNNTKSVFTSNSMSGGDVNSILGSYANTPSSKVNKRQHTPDNPVNKRLTGVGGPVSVPPFSPNSFSPVGSTPSKMYGDRKNAGDTVASLGTVNLISWKSKRNESNQVSIDYHNKDHLKSKYKYMFQKLSDKALILNDNLEELSADLQKHYSKDELSHVALPVQESITVVGRVACDSIGKINAKSVILEGSLDTSGGKTIPVELSTVPQFSIFPGQVVMMDGSNNTGGRFVATKLYEGIPPPLPEAKPLLQSGPLSVVIAAGPFTTTDSLQYEPLQDLLQYLRKETPDVCILLGPFVDSKQPNIEKACDKQTFEELFESTLKSIVTSVEGIRNLQLVIVPSQRDIHHEYVYPQPPFTVENLKLKNIHMVSDPCTLLIDDVVFGISATDILFHLGSEETSFPPGSSDRLSRLSRHVLTQQCYYPLHPPSEDVNIDYDLFEEHAKMNVTPHVLVMPSDLKQFVKDVCGSCVINPGRLAKAHTGGTYARVVISPGGKGTPSNAKSMVDSISAEVKRI